jgi:hypothetical protein
VNVKFRQTSRPTVVFHDEVKKQSWYSIFTEEFLADALLNADLQRVGQAHDIGGSPTGPFKQDDVGY